MKKLDQVIDHLSKLPGLGKRSARRMVLSLLKKDLMIPLAESLVAAHNAIHTCHICGHLDETDPCHICRDEKRISDTLCVVESVDDIWALERGGQFKGRYHVLGGLLSVLDGIGPDELRLNSLKKRIASHKIGEIIIALNSSMQGHTTTLFLFDEIHALDENITVTRIAQGIPSGGHLTYLDDTTLSVALSGRQKIS